MLITYRQNVGSNCRYCKMNRFASVRKFEQLSLINWLMCLLMWCSCLLLVASWIPSIVIEFY